MNLTNRYGFDGRHAVVTGGASGIGLAIASRLAAGGARITVWDRDPEALDRLSIAGAKVTAVQVDVTRSDSVAAAVQATLAAGAVDILVNSAGITGPNTTLWEYPDAAWDEVIAVNLRGVFLCCKHIVPVMRASNYGRIVNIASVAGKEGNPNASAYSASKAGVISITKSLGKELAATGIRVNCVTPAAVKTAMFSQMTQQHIDFMLSKIPMQRFGEVDEVAALVSWLASEECSFSTGATFDISGGRATF